MEQTPDIWHQISTTEDIDDLMNVYCGFHDSCIVALNFVSGTSVDSERSMVFCGYGKYAVNIIFHSLWNDYALELNFSGVRRLHLVGAQDNYSNDILEASIKFYDNLFPSSYSTPARVIIWADSKNFNPQNIEPQLIEPADTFIVAHTLKWRLIEK